MCGSQRLRAEFHRERNVGNDTKQFGDGQRSVAWEKAAVQCFVHERRESGVGRSSGRVAHLNIRKQVRVKPDEVGRMMTGT